MVSPWWNRLYSVLFDPWRTCLALPWTTVRESYSHALEQGPLLRGISNHFPHFFLFKILSRMGRFWDKVDEASSIEDAKCTNRERAVLVEGLLRSPIDHLAQFHCKFEIGKKEQKKGWKWINLMWSHGKMKKGSGALCWSHKMRREGKVTPRGLTPQCQWIMIP